MTTPSNHARDTVLGALQAAPTVVAFIPADRFYPNKAPNAPVRPYGRLGPVNSEPIRAGCWEGGSIDGAIHIFVSVTDAIADPESFAHDATDAIKQVLEALPDCFVDRILVQPDRGDADVMHGIVYYRFDAVQELAA